ncbi:MAG TPA: hypothetical protein VJW20_21460 [Candidatus Angelobacter sp.]|nr:hypothetical protein [Candidatus Angelobacter sp.]
MRKTIQTLLFAIIATAALYAGTVSAHQLRNGAAATTCGGTCRTVQDCAKGCFCSFTTPFTAFCTTHLAGAVPTKK